MKTFDEFTSMTELEAIASDDSVKVPEGLRDSINSSLNALSFLDEGSASGKSGALARISGIAAAIAVLVGVGFGIIHASNSPKDTFSDPYLAYAQLEETFTLISAKMDKGLSMAQEAEAMINRTNEIMNKIN
ncbi:MAG: hypothetical protein Q4G10_01920 [Bacteroidia bacterium]|nr:hypothetical protein [Bacteroidia bacterium]